MFAHPTQNVTNWYVRAEIYVSGLWSVKWVDVDKKITGEAPRMETKLKSGKRAAERIRETAKDLFYRQGIRAVGVDEIVERAGVTKPSLYRSFASKDALAAACLSDRSEDFLRRFDAAMTAVPENPRAGFHAWLQTISLKATKSDYRGCGLTNAAVEYPERGHPARLVAAANKKAFRKRLGEFATALGAGESESLADALLLLIEGAYASGQLFGREGPARVLAEAADVVIDGYLGKKAGTARSGRPRSASAPKTRLVR
jgi:AcrR family transcriptional regulator